MSAEKPLGLKFLTKSQPDYDRLIQFLLRVRKKFAKTFKRLKAFSLNIERLESKEEKIHFSGAETMFKYKTSLINITVSF